MDQPNGSNLQAWCRRCFSDRRTSEGSALSAGKVRFLSAVLSIILANTSATSATETPTATSTLPDGFASKGYAA
eukprot:1150901-Pelagomonas_calceolata.AAC.1